jgi:hypothetical protein
MRKSDDDLNKYLPDEATAAAAMDESATYGEEVPPELLARLAQLKTDPNIKRNAPESVSVYVPPTDVPSPDQDEKTLPRAPAKVALAPGPAAPSDARDLPTMPALKRLEGDQDVAVAVRIGRRLARAARRQPTDLARTPVRTAAGALLAVLAPVIIVIVLFVRPTPKNGTTPTATATANPTVAPSAPRAPPPPVAESARSIPSSIPSAAPSGSTAPSGSAAVPSAAPSIAPAPGRPLGSLPRRPDGTDDPYKDAAPAPSPPKPAEPPAPPPPPPAPASTFEGKPVF